MSTHRMHGNRLAIVLGRGTLGLELARVAGENTVCLGRDELDIRTSPYLIIEKLAAVAHQALDHVQFDRSCRIVVFNAAAYTAVDAAESDSASAYRVNALGAENVAKAVLGLDNLSKAWRRTENFDWTWSLVHVSTDAVFADAHGVSELDVPSERPLSVYGASKLAGEHLVKQVAAQGLETYLVRTANLYGVHGRNWASTLREKLLRVEEVQADVSRRIAPTWAAWAARVMMQLLESPAGTYHVCADAGSYAPWWADFARQMAVHLQVELKLERVRLAETRAAELGHHGTLSSVMLPLRGIEVPAWKYQLEQYLRSAE